MLTALRGHCLVLFPSLASMGARRVNRQPDKSVLQDGIYVNERFLHAFASCIGCVVQVTVKNGKVYEGVLRTTSPKVEIVLERAHPVDESSDASPNVIASDTVIKTLIFQKSDVVMMTVADVNLDYAIIDGYADGSASKCNGLIRKELEPWVADGAANEDSLEAIEDSVDSFDRNETGWDANEMFSTNAQKFNIKSDYDPNLTQYTTPLQKSDTAEYRQREAHAQKLAMEIERGSDHARRSALENSEENGDDEEMAFSAVHRPMSAGSQSTGKYVVPHLRNSATVSPALRQQQPASSNLPTTVAAPPAAVATASPQQQDTVSVTPSNESSVRVNGPEETMKNSLSVAVHETAESRAPRKDLPTPSQTLVRQVPHKQEVIADLKDFSNNFKLSESDVQDRKPSASLAVSTVASSTASSLGSSTTDVLPASSTTPQSTQPVLPPQPGVEIMENKGASPALENKESDDVAKKSSLNPLAKEFNPTAKPPMRVMPSSTPPRQVSVPLSPTSSYPPMPGGQVVYPAPQPPTFVPVPQSQSSQRLSGPQNKRVTVSARGATNDGTSATPQSTIMNGAPLMTPPVVPVAYPQQSLIPVGHAFPQYTPVRLIAVPAAHEPANQMAQMVSSSQPGMYFQITPHGGMTPSMQSQSQSGQQPQQTPQQSTASGHQTPTPSQHTPYAVQPVGPGVGVMHSAAGTPPQTHLFHPMTQHPVMAPQGPAPPSPQVNFTSGPMPFSQGVMTLVPTQQAQQPVGGTPSQSAGPAAGPPHHMMITQPAAQQHSLHTVPQQMIMPSQPQAGIQPPPVGAHQYVQAHPMPGNVPPGHANVAAQHVINMPTNVTPTMYLQHHPAVHPGPQGQPYQHSAAQ